MPPTAWFLCLLRANHPHPRRCSKLDIPAQGKDVSEIILAILEGTEPIKEKEDAVEMDKN